MNDCSNSICNICTLSKTVIGSELCIHKVCEECWSNISSQRANFENRVRCPFCRCNVTEWVDRNITRFCRKCSDRIEMNAFCCACCTLCSKCCPCAVCEMCEKMCEKTCENCSDCSECCECIRCEECNYIAYPCDKNECSYCIHCCICKLCEICLTRYVECDGLRISDERFCSECAENRCQLCVLNDIQSFCQTCERCPCLCTCLRCEICEQLRHDEVCPFDHDICAGCCSCEVCIECRCHISQSQSVNTAFAVLNAV